MSRWLIAVAVAAEAEAIGVPAAVVGVGPAAAAAGTAHALAQAAAAGRPYTHVMSVGIAGGFIDVGRLAIADTIVAADLGAESPDGFIALDELGFGTATIPVDPSRLAARLPKAAVGPILTVSTVTGTATSAAALRARYPAAVAEAMEGFGVAMAARAWGLPALELRAISNAIGPRDRSAWRIGPALAALAQALQTLHTTTFFD